MKHAVLRAVFIAGFCGTLLAAGVASFGDEPPAINRFRDAIRHGNADLVRAMLLADPALANQRDGDNLCSPLYYAVTYGHTGIARLLLDNGADVNGTDRQGSTVICHANSAEIAALLLDRHAMFSDLAMRNAAEAGYAEVVNVFLKAGARLDFHSAVELGISDSVREMLEKQLDLAQSNHKPLHAAASRGHYDVCAMLLERGADPNLDYGFANVRGPYTPLSNAITEGHYEVAKLLLEHGANSNVSAGRNHGNLFLFAIAYLDDRFVRLMLEHEVDVQAGEHWVKGATPLHVAAALGGAADTIHVVRWAQPSSLPKHKCQALEKARLLLAAGAEVNATSEDGSTPLLAAALAGHRDVCELLLDNGAELDIASACLLGNEDAVRDLLRTKPQLFTSKDGPLRRPLLYWAAQVGDSALAKRLLKAGADPNSRAPPLEYQDAGGFSAHEWQPSESETPLRVACRRGHLEVAQLLIERGAVVDEPGHRDQSPLYYAYSGGHANVVKLLLQEGARFRFKEEEWWWYLPPENDNGTVFKLLLDSMAGDDLKGEFGTRLLTMAIEGDRVSAAELLIERGAKPDLSTACAVGRLGDVRTMLDADPAIVNASPNGRPGQSPIVLAARNGHQDVVAFLISRGAETEPGKLGGVSLLHEAASHGHVELLRFLLDRGMTPDAKDQQGGSLLHAAAGGERPEVVRFMLSRGGDVHAVNYDGKTPLHSAAICWESDDGGTNPDLIDRSLATAKLLLEAGAKVNARDDSGWTPLHDAAARGNVELAEALIAAGAKVNIPSHRNLTPLAICESEQRSSLSPRDAEPVAALLRRHGAVRKLPP